MVCEGIVCCCGLRCDGYPLALGEYATPSPIPFTTSQVPPDWIVVSNGFCVVVENGSICKMSNGGFSVVGEVVYAKPKPIWARK